MIIRYLRKGKGQKVKFTLEQATKTQTEWRYSCTLSVTLDGGGWSRHATAILPPGKRPGTNCTGDCVGPRARLEGKGKLKCTLVQALRLCTGLTAHRGSKGIALLFHDHGTRRG